MATCSKQENLQREVQQEYPPRNWNILVFKYIRHFLLDGQIHGPRETQRGALQNSTHPGRVILIGK